MEPDIWKSEYPNGASETLLLRQERETEKKQCLHMRFDAAAEDSRGIIQQLPRGCRGLTT